MRLFAKKFLFLLIPLLALCGCSKSYDEWHEISISDVGTIKIDESMAYVEDNGIMCIKQINESDSEDVRLFLIGTEIGKDFDSRISEYIKKEVVFSDTVKSEVFSNSATVGTQRYFIDNQLCEILFLELYSSKKTVLFIAPTGTIDYDMISKIGKSFEMCN